MQSRHRKQLKLHENHRKKSYKSDKSIIANTAVVASDKHRTLGHCRLEDIQDEGRLAGGGHLVADPLQRQHRLNLHHRHPSRTCSRHRSSGPEDHLAQRNLVLVLEAGPVLDCPELQEHRDQSTPKHPSTHKACTVYPGTLRCEDQRSKPDRHPRQIVLGP